MVLEAGTPSRPGLYVCGHCEQVVTPSQREIDTAENAPAGSLVKLKCPCCKHWAVAWHQPSKERAPRVILPVDGARAATLFALIYQELKK